MKFTSLGINMYTFFNLPSAWWCGVRVKKISSKYCCTKVNLNWINKNPFKSIFWAIQGMAAELSTGVLIMQASKSFKCDISMLVINNKATFTKKAKGQIVFSCDNGEAVDKTFTKLLKTNKSQTLWLKAKGIDKEGDIVSTFDFEWTLLLK
tara:strand:- start:26354 stop:26806 length:453 start_codon:yes stop_codon:yes gene_type:complete